MADATININGRIASEPRFNSVNGKSVANIKVLAGRSKKNDDGTWENLSSTAYDIAYWNQHAELVDSLNPQKGDSVTVTGTVGGVESFQCDKGVLLSVKVNGDGLRVFPKRQDNSGNFQHQSSGQQSWGNQQSQQQPGFEADPWSSSNAQGQPPF